MVKIEPPYASDSASFGNAVDLDQDTLVVGAPYLHVNGAYSVGAAHVYSRDQGGENQWGLVADLAAPDAAQYDFFGSAVAVDGDTIVVAADEKDQGANTKQGAVYVYERNQGGSNHWGLVQTLSAGSNAEFGYELALASDTLAISAKTKVGANSAQGSVYLYRRDPQVAGSWYLAKEIIAADGKAYDLMGSALALDGDRLVAGVPARDLSSELSNEGMSYVFDRNIGGAEQWGERAQLFASDAEYGDTFGYAVAVDAGTVVVTAPYDDVEAEWQGSAYVFTP